MYRELGGFNMDDKWIRIISERLKTEMQAKKTQDEKFVETKKLKRSLAPGVWNELRDWLNEYCAALNKEMGTDILNFSLLTGGDVEITPKGEGIHRTMIVSFNSVVGTLEYRSTSGEPSKTFEIVVDSQGHASFGERGLPFGHPVEYIGKEILNHALHVFRR
jgi:hypothetical protein